jgi:hypothetical protein
MFKRLKWVNAAVALNSCANNTTTSAKPEISMSSKVRLVNQCNYTTPLLSLNISSTINWYTACEPTWYNERVAHVLGLSYQELQEKFSRGELKQKIAAGPHNPETGGWCDENPRLSYTK